MQHAVTSEASTDEWLQCVARDFWNIGSQVRVPGCKNMKLFQEYWAIFENIGGKNIGLFRTNILAKAILSETAQNDRCARKHGSVHFNLNVELEHRYAVF